MAEKDKPKVKEKKDESEKSSHKAEHNAEHSAEHKSEHKAEHKAEHSAEHKAEHSSTEQHKAEHPVHKPEHEHAAENVEPKAPKLRLKDEKAELPVVKRRVKKRASSEASPSWVEYKPKEISEVVVTLSNQGRSSSEIGMILRDQYGIPNIRSLAGKSIEDILSENNILPQIPEDLMSLIKKSVKLKSHLDKNKKDFSGKHGYMLTVSKIRKLVKYYLAKKRLPQGWRFSEETAALLVK